MTIRDYTNLGEGESKQLYEVKYEGTPHAGKDARVHLLATDLEDAIEMFCIFYRTRSPNPQEIPDELSNEDWQIGRRVITGIEKVTNAVLTRVEQPAKKGIFSE